MFATHVFAPGLTRYNLYISKIHVTVAKPVNSKPNKVHYGCTAGEPALGPHWSVHDRTVGYDDLIAFRWMKRKKLRKKRPRLTVTIGGERHDYPGLQNWYSSVL